MTLRAEAFLTADNLEAVTGVSLGVNRPAKSGSNPLWPVQASDGTVPTWGFGYPSVRQNGATTEIFGTCFESPSIANVHLCSPQTTDGTTITLPSRGLVTFNGNTNNNLITPASFTRNQHRVTWDEVSQTYVCFSHWNDGANFHTDLFQAASPQTTGWGSYVKRITAPLGAGVGNAQSCEPMALFRRADGRWFLFIQTSQYPTADYGSSRRHVGALLGPAGGGLTGTWTNLGSGQPYNAILVSPDGANQFYHAGGWVDGDLAYVPIGIFDGSAAPPSGHSLSTWPVNCINRVALYVAPASDPTDLTLVDDTWLSATGIEGDFDGGEIIGANNVAEVDDEWRYYFGGDDDTHHQTPELRRSLGLAVVARRRVGKITGTGSCRTTTVTPDAGRAATITVNTASGTVLVELLDASNNVISGFAQSDCDAITAGAFDQTVTWNGREETPTDTPFKAKLYMTSAEVNFLEALDADPVEAPSISGAGVVATAFGATVSASVNPNGSATTYRVQYGLTTGYGSVTDWVSAGSGVSPVAVEVVLSGLLPATGYHARLMAQNTNGTAYGPDLPFTTGTPVWSLTLDESSQWSQDGAAITATALTGRRTSVPATAYSENGGLVIIRGANAARFDIDETDPPVLTAGVPLEIELGVTPQDGDGTLVCEIGIPD